MTAALPPPGWPLADWSRIVTHRPHRWHVQEAGAGPTLMFIHGAAGATHSWRDILPDLARDHHVVALDLPGQGFTRMGTRARCGLAPSSEDIASLAEAQGWRVDTVIGHSAGAAIALQLAGDLDPAPRRVIGINAALEHFSGAAGWLFPAMAKMMAANPLTATMLSLSATRGMVERLLGVTGGEIDARGIDCYLHLFRMRAHVDATLAMMAQWSLAPLDARLPRLTQPVLFVTGERDTAVAPRVSEDAAARMPNHGSMRLRPVASAQFAPCPASTTSGTASRTAGAAASSITLARAGDEAFHRVLVHLEQQFVMDLQQHPCRQPGDRGLHADHRPPDDVRGAALDRRVDRGARANPAVGPLALISGVWILRPNRVSTKPCFANATVSSM
jgi:magnesium chelatase accessory protein